MTNKALLNPVAINMVIDNEQENFSKSERKRQHHAFTTMGVALCALNRQQLQMFDLDDKLLEAIILAKKINSHSAQKRQRQYIGKLLAHLPQTQQQQIHEQLEELRQCAQTHTRRFHQLEVFRDSILAQGDSFIQQLVTDYPQLERRYLRQLYRQAQYEKERQQPPKSARKLFQYLREQIML